MNFVDGLSKTAVERTLNLLPEVTWDRWYGELDEMAIFGWIARDDGKSDFVLLRFSSGECWMFETSSARYSAEFAIRLGFCKSAHEHKHCKRVEGFFTGVKSVHLS